MNNNHKRDESLVGTIDFSNIEDSNNRLSFRSIGLCDIYIYGDEGAIPHFHIKSKNGIFECCVCIFEPLYFNHEYKTDTLNINQRKLLNEWLSRKHKMINATNWEAIRFLWIADNQENVEDKIYNYNTQPDYTNMENYKFFY